MKQAKQNDMSSNSDENNNRMMKINNQPSYFKNKQEVEVEFKRKVKDEEVNQDKMMMIKSQEKMKKRRANNKSKVSNDSESQLLPSPPLPSPALPSPPFDSFPPGYGREPRNVPSGHLGRRPGQSQLG